MHEIIIAATLALFAGSALAADATVRVMLARVPASGA